ncbi:MAG: hypothetical protein A2Z44_07215 [Betaproteobacteria bacterium RBG_19FT_COMBO_58_11]|nr:MAG: hypothetical protein A2Z44_07215 [Betaproteobacteria bacterium RBG_19FT_COMBO_58_11]
MKFEGQATEFHGYDVLDFSGRVLALYKEGAQVSSIQAGDEAVVVLDRTPFYAESGGQVGDRGELNSTDGTFQVDDTQKIQAEVFGHKGVLKIGKLSVGDAVEAHVDPISRHRSAWNHSATHLLHAALRKVLGKHVTQKGSLVDAQRTRFDFAHSQPVTAEEIQQIESLVNAAIRSNYPVEVRRMKYDQAIKHGAMALFGEKYGDEVRVIGMGDFSTELCGGTHVKRCGDIGLFKIVSEGGVAAGIRRIEAMTGDGALEYIQKQQQTLLDAASALKAQPQEISQKIAQILDNVKALEKELARIKSKLAAAKGDDLTQSAVEVNGTKVLAAEIDGADAKALRETLDKLKDKLGSAAIVLASREGGKVTLIAGVTADLTAKVKAGELVNHVATQCGGKGGGRADMAQAGGTLPDNLPKALASVASFVGGKL